MSELHRSQIDFSYIGDIRYWEQLNPELTVTDRPFLHKPLNLHTGSLDQAKYVKQMQQEGYVCLNGVVPRERIDLMAQAVTRLIENNHPPVFCYIYDEFWQIFRDISPVISPIFGDNYRLSVNRWAWYIPATGDDAGFSPHRDMSGWPHPVLRDNGLPLIATVWIPLTDVYTSNACMHVLPLTRDPNAPDNLSITDVPQCAIQDIRALPGDAGSVMSWNPNVLHWGSRSSQWVDLPRISIATYIVNAQDTNFASIRTDPFQPVTFDSRLRFVGQTMAHYHNESIISDRYSPGLLKFLRKYETCEPNEWRFPQADGRGKQQQSETDVSQVKVGRNEPCPCGSGKKYKRCHGV